MNSQGTRRKSYVTPRVRSDLALVWHCIDTGTSVKRRISYVLSSMLRVQTWRSNNYDIVFLPHIVHVPMLTKCRHQISWFSCTIPQKKDSCRRDDAEDHDETKCETWLNSEDENNSITIHRTGTAAATPYSPLLARRFWLVARGGEFTATWGRELPCILRLGYKWSVLIISFPPFPPPPFLNLGDRWPTRGVPFDVIDSWFRFCRMEFKNKK